MSEPTLKTGRLRLRPVGMQDLAELHALWLEPSVRRFLLDDRLVSPDEVRGFIEASAANFAQRGWGLWRVDLPDPDTAPSPAGFAGFLRSEEDLPDLIYGIDPSLVGAGHATEAAEAVLEYVFARDDVPRVAASVDGPNAASIRILEKLGMRLARSETGSAGPLLFYELERPSS